MKTCFTKQEAVKRAQVWIDSFGTEPEPWTRAGLVDYATFETGRFRNPLSLKLDGVEVYRSEGNGGGFGGIVIACNRGEEGCVTAVEDYNGNTAHFYWDENYVPKKRKKKNAR